MHFRGKLIFTSNELPMLKDAKGMWRQVVLAPFENEVPDDRRRPQIFDEMEEELSGILNWALDWLERLPSYSHSWPIPKRSQALMAEYREAADPFEMFLAEQLILDTSTQPLDGVEIYTQYRGYVTVRGYEPMVMGPAFWTGLRRAGLTHDERPTTVKDKCVRLWRGARLAEQSQEEFMATLRLRT